MDKSKNTPELQRVLISAKEIDQRVLELATKINEDYKDIKQPLILVGVLKGSFIFLADLCRKITVPHVVDFISVSSYGISSKTTGNVRMLMDTRENQEGHHVLIVEDILDSGYTLEYLNRNFKTRGTLSVKNIVLLDKPRRHVVPVDIHYLGFEVPDVWVVGYGLDYAEKFRTLPYIAEMKKIEE